MLTFVNNNFLTNSTCMYSW